MRNHYSSLDLRKALGNQNYLILDNKYKQQLANHPLVRNLYATGEFFVIVANIYALRTEFVCGECEKVSGYSAEEIESRHGEFLFNFALQEDCGFDMEITKLGMDYFTSRPEKER